MTTNTNHPTPRQKTEQHWKTHVLTWQTTGLSQATYCKNENINPGIFSKWKVHFLGKEKTKQPSTKPKFVPIELESKGIPSTPNQHSLEVTLPNKLVVSIPPTMRPQQITSYIEALCGVRC